MKSKELINQIEEFIDEISNEWTLRKVEVRIVPKYGDNLIVEKEINQDG